MGKRTLKTRKLTFNTHWNEVQTEPILNDNGSDIELHEIAKTGSFNTLRNTDDVAKLRSEAFVFKGLSSNGSRSYLPAKTRLYSLDIDENTELNISTSLSQRGNQESSGDLLLANHKNGDIIRTTNNYFYAWYDWSSPNASNLQYWSMPSYQIVLYLKTNDEVFSPVFNCKTMFWNKIHDRSSFIILPVFWKVGDYWYSGMIHLDCEIYNSTSAYAQGYIMKVNMTYFRDSTNTAGSYGPSIDHIEVRTLY